MKMGATKMRGRCRWLMACALGAAGLACATPPKPRELEAFDTLRKTNEATLPEAAKRSPDLASEADRRSAAAHDEWQSNDLEESRRDALIATIKLKSALAIYEQDQLKARIQTLSGQQAQAEEESAELNKDLASEQEKLALLQKYVDARQTADADKERLSQQMSTEQQKAQAEQQRLSQQLVSEQKIAAAQLALRTADTVEASKYATAEYTAAGDLLAKADAELKQNDYTAAQASAEVAKKNADRAAELAKPQYEQAAQSNENKARNEALARDAPAIEGVKVRIDPRGDLQRLVVVIPALFKKREPDIEPGHETVLDGVAALLKKYPSYPVQVIGYTDNRGKSTELIAVSAARAQAVYSALAERGVEVKRLMVSGLGGEDPFVDNRSAAGRAKNNRVEIVFMYH
jgi:outer membrane protein OmpA-like peptidoglycan-associated protein